MSFEQSVVDHGIGFLGGLLERIGFEGIEIAVGAERADTLVLELTGQIEALQRQPEVTSALTLLTSQSTSRAADARVRCLLDVGGAFEQREALLKVLARDVADAVALTGRIGVIEKLDAGDRRVVHRALTNRSDVATQSEGEARARHLTVSRT